MFLVRAENSQGMSLPSGVSELARTLSIGAAAVVPHQLDEARSRLATRVINLSQLTALSSTSVKLTWDVSPLNSNRSSSNAKISNLVKAFACCGNNCQNDIDCPPNFLVLS